MSKLFDPLGWFASIKMTLRLFIRELAYARMDWNRPLTIIEKQKLQGILESLKKVTAKGIPRTENIGKDGQLHIFCDATIQAFGAVAYVVNPLTKKSMLVAAKVKLVPKKTGVITKKTRVTGYNTKIRIDGRPVRSSFSARLIKSIAKKHTSHVIFRFLRNIAKNQAKPKSI